MSEGAISWGGWRVDEAAPLLLSPVKRLMPEGLHAVFSVLVAAEGKLVLRSELEEAILARTRTKNPVAYVRAVAHHGNAFFRKNGIRAPIACSHGLGYYAKPTDGFAPPKAAADVAADEASAKRRARVEAILVEELEATGPHARRVSRMIEEVYG